MATDNLYNDISIFDAEYYLANNPLLAAALEEAGVSAQEHYYLHGAAESAEGGVDGEFRLPNAWFDIDFYRTTKPGLEDVPANELLAHFALHGSKELLAPNPAYADENGKLKVAELAAYLEANPGVKEAVAEMTGTEVGAELTPEQASIAAFHFFTYGIEEGLSGGIADIKPVNPIEPDETDSLTEALTTLAAAQAESANALKAMNEALGETDAEGKVTPAEYANAEEAETALTEKVTEAEETRDAELAKTVGKQADDLIDGLVKSLGTNATLTEANLNTALDAVQAEIDNNTVVFTKDGSVNTDATDATFNLGDPANEVLDLSGIETDNNVKVDFAKVNTDNNKGDAQGGGGKDTVILPDFSADYTGTLTLEGMILGQNPDKGFDTLVAPNLASQFTTVKFSNNEAKGGNGYLTVTLANAAGGTLVLKDLIKGETFAAKFYNGGENVEFNEGGLTAFIAALNGDESASKEVKAWSNAADVPKSDVDADLTLTVNPSSVGEFVGQLVAYGNLKTSANTSGLEQVGFTLADLQDAASDAAEALATARAVESDAALLEDVSAGIGAYLAAGGNNSSILELRTKLEGELEDGSAQITGYTSDKVLETLLDDMVTVTNGVATIEAPEAPELGQGKWVEGDAAEGGDFVFTYEPSAAEQGLLDVVANVDARDELITAESETEVALNTAGGALEDNLIAQLNAINGQLDVLADAEQALVDAQDALTDAKPSIDALKAAEQAQLDAEQWFEDNGYELPIELDGTVNATVENDIFLFNPEAETAIVTDFGKQGEDSIFFGEGFTLVEIDEKGITGDQGDVNTLEILWQQVGNNVELYVEEFAFAGNGSGTADLTKVTLVGVNGSDLQDNLESGLLSLGDLIA